VVPAVVVVATETAFLALLLVMVDGLAEEVEAAAQVIMDLPAARVEMVAMDSW